MSESVPVFKCGEKVRIMQTGICEMRGISNRRGVVIYEYQPKYECQQVRIQTPQGAITVPATSVMHDW